MNPAFALNLFFGSAVIIALILADCLTKSPIGKLKKYLFCSFLLISLFFLVLDFCLTLISRQDYIILFGKNKTIGIIINFVPVFLSLCVIFFLNLANNQTRLLIIALLSLFTASLGINILTISFDTFWPVITALLLYAYLFVILNESKIDSLTGLNNRYSFFEFTARLLRNKPGETWTITLIDINDFKSLNNVYGNLEGDNVLRALADIIKDSIKEEDFAARYDGDAFLLLTKNKNNTDYLISVVMKKLDDYNKSGYKPYNIDISYGSALFPTDESIPIDDFLNHIQSLMKKYNDDKRRAENLNLSGSVKAYMEPGT